MLDFLLRWRGTATRADAHRHEGGSRACPRRRRPCFKARTRTRCQCSTGPSTMPTAGASRPHRPTCTSRAGVRTSPRQTAHGPGRIFSNR
ncbi:hypothetical protein BC628DRAFT_1352060 [Trametes gibbosa]|nr:hypothetical protein BC628DRAFT_1352060 [Trametes gibbosa]